MPSNHVHLLAGHDIGGPLHACPEAFPRLLEGLGRYADLVDIETAVELIRTGATVSRPTIAFTFDDGFLDCYQHLAPALDAFGINAAFFINTRYIGASPDYVERFNRVTVRSPGRLPMTTDMVRELSDRGFVIAAHTGDHRNLTTTDDSVIEDQVIRCKDEVEDMTGLPCPWFAWPYGGYEHVSDRAISAALGTYEVVFSSDRYSSYSSYGGRVLNRRHFEVYWPAAHVRYFLAPERTAA